MPQRYRSSRFVRRRVSSTQTSYKPFTTRRLEKKSRNRLIITAILAIFLIYAAFTWLLPALIGGLSFINNFKTTKPVTQVADKTTLAPPVLNIPYEATNTAVINIHGYAQAGTDVQIYLDDELKSTVPTNQDGSFLSDSIHLNLGTNHLYGKTADKDNNISLQSKTIFLTFEDEKPTLNLDSPEDNKVQQGGDRRITVSGSTDSQKDVIVTANGSRIIVTSDGKFSGIYTLNDGDNIITVIAADNAGNSTTITRKVTYNP